MSMEYSLVLAALLSSVKPGSAGTLLRVCTTFSCCLLHYPDYLKDP